MIEVTYVKKIYEGEIPTLALKDISLSIKEGEFVAIMGRSGSGKSTLLHQLGLLDSPTEGKITIDGIGMTHLSDDQRTRFRLESLGYVFQEYALVAELTALENVYLPAFALKEDYQVYKKRAQEMLELVNLKDRINHYPRELSGGEQQRVAIARALINKPKILFADEPTANLDTASTKVVLELFKKLNKELKQTIIMVTHEPEDMHYVDRVISLRDGLIIEDKKVKR